MCCWHLKIIVQLDTINNYNINNQHRHIYKSRHLIWKSMRFCHMEHFLKIIEILLNHIRDKNKFKNIDSLFPLVQCFKTIFFFTFSIQCFKTTIYFIWFNVSRPSISHTHIKLFAFSFILFTSTPLYTHAHNPHVISS